MTEFQLIWNVLTNILKAHDIVKKKKNPVKEMFSFAPTAEFVQLWKQIISVDGHAGL